MIPGTVDPTAFAKDQRAVGAELAKKTPQTMKLPGWPGAGERHILIAPDGSIIDAEEALKKALELPAGPRDYKAETFESFCSMVNEFAERETPTGTAAATTSDGASPQEIAAAISPPIFIFVSSQQSSIVALLDEGDRTERLTFPLTKTSTWKRLTQLRDETESLNQRDILDLLRRELDAVYTPGNLITILRSLKFEANSEGTSEIQVGKASIGKSVQAKLTGADALPEDVVVNAPIWDNVFVDSIPRTADVRCAFDANTEDQTFFIRPKAGQIEVHERAAMEWLVEQVAKHTDAHSHIIRVFAGREK